MGLLDLYDREQGGYSEFARRMKSLLEDILAQERTAVHSVTARAKTRESLKHKIRQREPAYTNLHQVTDLAGVRCITYFPDDVDRIGALIEGEFEVDRENSVDKRKALDPDRFGYLSLHYVVSLSRPRLDLVEYRPFAGKKCEIQVRSVLQHAWAEVEHDLGYKSVEEVPRHIRRRFSRVAGLLELADIEFSGIRDDLSHYENEVRGKIGTHSQLLLDGVSLREFIRTDQVVADLDRIIVDHLGGELIEEPMSELTHSMQRLGLTTIEELKDVMRSRVKLTERFAKGWTKKKVPSTVRIHKGISLFYLRYVLLAERGDAELIRELFPEFVQGTSGFENRILQTYERAKIPEAG